MARADAVVRIILVGTTGLDESLSRHGGVEVTRAPGVLDAIGLLAGGLASGRTVRTVVIVGNDADKNAESTLGSSADEVVDGLKLVDPHVRVLLMLGASGALPEPADVAAYDGFVPSGAGVEEVLRAIDPALSGEQASDGGLHADGPPGDAAMVAAILAGKDVTPVAMSILRARLNDPDAALNPPGGEPPPGSARVSAPGGGEHGWLSAPSASAGQLLAHAAWLSAWLRLQHQQATLRRAAFTDALTGAWNRRYFERFLASAIDQARGGRLSLSVLLLDIDDFKRFNDTFGHAAADEILVEVVKMLQSVIRPTDRVCRIGGDEFAVIFHEPAGPRTPGSTPPRAVAQIAERFQRQIHEQRFPKLGIDAPGRLTVSAGLATYPWDGTTPDEIIRRADELARLSKQQGKNALRMGPDAEPA